MIAPEFWEIGASGARYGRQLVLDTVCARLATGTVQILRGRAFALQELAAGLFLVTYELDQDGRRTRRSTIWRRTPDGWQAVFHQGTVCASSA